MSYIDLAIDKLEFLTYNALLAQFDGNCSLTHKANSCKFLV